MLKALTNYGTVGLVVWAVFGPAATYAWTTFAATFEKRAAVKAAVSEAKSLERSACDQRVTEIQTKLNNHTLELQRLAAEAEASVAPTPTNIDERRALCNRSASCRSRQKEGVQ